LLPAWNQNAFILCWFANVVKDYQRSEQAWQMGTTYLMVQAATILSASSAKAVSWVRAVVSVQSIMAHA
jgi:hypothetical protein